MKKIIITGANGFIGNHCLRLLNSKEYEIHAFSRKSLDKRSVKNVKWHQVDLLKEDEIQNSISEIKPNYLLHNAWDMSTRNLNDSIHLKWLKAGLNLMESFAENGGERLVIAGSCAEYDWDYGICSETQTPLNSQSLYGTSKHTLQLIVDSYCKHNELSYAWGRIFFAYGPGGNPDSLIPYIIKNLANEKIVEILQSKQVRDYIYVEDIAKALVSLIDSNIEGPINISSGTPTEIKEIALKIAVHFDKEHLIEFKDQEILDKSYPYVVGDNSRLLKELNWKPKITLDNGLKKTIQSLI